MNKLFFNKLNLDAKKSYVNGQIVSARALFNQVDQTPEFSSEIKRIINETEELLAEDVSDFAFEKELLIALNLYLLYLEQKKQPEQLLISRDLNNRLQPLLNNDEKRQVPNTTAEEWQNIIANSTRSIKARSLLIFIYHDISAYSANLVRKCTEELLVADFDFDKLCKLIELIEKNEALIFEGDRHAFLDIKITCRKKLVNLFFLKIKEDTALLQAPFDEDKVRQLKEAYGLLLRECEAWIELEKSRVAILHDDAFLMLALLFYSTCVEAYLNFLLSVHKSNESDHDLGAAIKNKIYSFQNGFQPELITDVRLINEILPYIYQAAIYRYCKICTASDCHEAEGAIDEFIKVVNSYQGLIEKSQVAAHIYAAHFSYLQNLKTAVVNDAPPTRKFTYHIKSYEAAKEANDHQKVIEVGNLLVRCLRQIEGGIVPPYKHSISSLYVDMADAYAKQGQADLAIEYLVSTHRRTPLTATDHAKLLRLLDEQLEKNPCNHRTAFLIQSRKDFRVRNHSSSDSAIRHSSGKLFDHPQTTILVTHGPATLSGKKREREPTPTL